MNLRMFFYTAANNGEWLQALSECILLTKEAFHKNGVSTPFSTHTIDVRHVGELAGALQPALQKAAQNGQTTVQSAD